MAPKDDKGNSSAVLEMITGVPVGTMSGGGSGDSSAGTNGGGKPPVGVPAALAPVKPSGGSGNSSSSSNATMEMITGVPAGTMSTGGSGGSPGASDNSTAATLNMLYGLSEAPDESSSAPTDAEGYGDSSDPSKFTGSLLEILDLVDSGAASDGRTSVGAPENRSLSVLSLLIDGESGLPDNSNDGVPTALWPVYWSNVGINATGDLANSGVNAAVDAAQTGKGVVPRALRWLYSDALDAAGNFTSQYGKGSGAAAALTLPLAVNSDMQGGDSIERALAREVPSAAVGFLVGAQLGAAVGTFVPIPIVGTVGGAVVGALGGGLAAMAMSNGLNRVLPKFANGGIVSGPGTKTSDSVLARVSDGEFVMNALATERYLPLLSALNSGWVPSAELLHRMVPGFSSGGLVGNANSPDSTNSYLSDALKSFELNQAQLASSALQGALSGSENGGLVDGITGGIKGLASAAGSQIGSGIGAAIGTAVGGPVGTAIGGALGSVVGSEVLGSAAELITKPIEFAAETVKEVVGTGFGLTDLAEGPGGRTQRGDIYNISGMDPKSVKTAVERVRRRKLVAVSRGGGAK